MADLEELVVGFVVGFMKAQLIEQGSIGSQCTRIPRRGREEGRGKDTSIYIAPRLGRAPN